LPRRAAATAWVLNESTYEKSYDGQKLPLGPAPVCGLKSLFCKEGRLVVPLAVSFCFSLRVDANSVRWRALCAPRALPGPPEGQVAISSTQQPKLPYWQLTGAHTHFSCLLSLALASCLCCLWVVCNVLSLGNWGQVKRRVHARTHARTCAPPPAPRAPPPPPLSPLPPIHPYPSPHPPPPPPQHNTTFLPLLYPQTTFFTSVLSISGIARGRCQNSRGTCNP
jgi:hypothetical protein